VVQYIDNYDQLKRAIEKSMHKYIKDQSMKNVQLDEDIKTEYENQKKYLNNSVTSIKKRLEKERKIHKEEHINIMKTNVKLIEEIKTLRTEVLRLDN
jgi:bacterioferritin (cytochrome b1)